jgi:hypothetical protein
VLDANSGTVLDTRTISGFSNGNYVAWNVGGHATFRLTAVAGNAVISGVFFGSGGGAGVPATATYLAADTATQGFWKETYGMDGSAIANDLTSNPPYARLTVGGMPFNWAGSTTDVRALQKSATTDRIASAWYSPSSFTIDVNITDGATHQVELYCLDWDRGGRSERIDVLDGGSGTVLDTRTISSFSDGEYLVWNVSGHATFRITPLGGNAVVSGVFFGGGTIGTGVAATATYLTTDATTQGSWKGTYGTNGSVIANDLTNNPTYAQLTVSGTAYAWAGSTTDVRALQKTAATDRIASAWYSPSSFTIDVNITDGATHQVELYCLDWDRGSRSERIDVLSASSGVVLDTRSISGFSNGEYLVWNVSGHVTFRVTPLTGNTVISGVFFGSR